MVRVVRPCFTDSVQHEFHHMWAVVREVVAAVLVFVTGVAAGEHLPFVDAGPPPARHEQRRHQNVRCPPQSVRCVPVPRPPSRRYVI